MGYYEVVLRNCATGQQMLIAATVAMDYMVQVPESEATDVRFEKEGFQFLARYEKESVIITRV